MSLELRKTSKHFYARVRVNGKLKTIALQQCYEGTPPPSLRIKQQGDAAFERTRGMALKEEVQLKEELARPQSQLELTKRVYKAQMDSEIKPIPILDLYTISYAYIRKRPWSDGHAKQVKKKHELLVKFLKKKYPNIEYAHQVTRPMAEAFMIEHQKEAKFGAKTFGDIKIILQGLWTVLESLELNTGNPFKNIVKPEYISVTKEAFSVEELDQILSSAKSDKTLYSVVVLASSTGMRLKDCCLLKWSSIDLKNRVIMVPALNKTQKPASIPIFGELERLVLDSRAQCRDVSQYVLPIAQKRYQRNKEYFTRVFADLLLEMGYTDDNAETSIRVESSDGCRKRPVRSFGSLKTTWMTMALRSGVSLEDIKKICGNVDTGVILKHYYKSDGERIRRMLQSNMPKSLGGAEFSEESIGVLSSQLLNLIGQIDGENWPFIVERLKEGIRGLGVAGIDNRNQLEHRRDV